MANIYKNHKIDRSLRKLTNKQLQVLWAETIDRPVQVSPRYLLSESVKTLKGNKSGFLTGICYMSAAALVGGVATCSHHKIAGCANNCLVWSGHMSDRRGIEARRDRLLLLIRRPDLFFEVLRREVAALKRRARSIGYRVAGRLNGTTDLDWTRILFDGRSIFQHFRGVRWYDYTKNPHLADNYQRAGVHVTLSYYKRLDRSVLLSAIDRGVNVAIAYVGGVPAVQAIGDRAVRVIDGDAHDLRFLDRRGVIVGLAFKSASMRDDARARNQAALESGYIIEGGGVL